MKTLITCIPLLLLAASSMTQADSKRTANYLRLDPESHANKEVVVDVSTVRPVHWKSPVEDIAFFHALTIDCGENKSGGTILVAIPAAESTKFAKKYGMTFESRRDRTPLEGTFVLASGRGRSGLWMLDTTGKIPDLLKENKLQLPAGAGGDMGRGERRHLGPRALR